MPAHVSAHMRFTVVCEECINKGDGWESRTTLIPSNAMQDAIEHNRVHHDGAPVAYADDSLQSNRYDRYVDLFHFSGSGFAGTFLVPRSIARKLWSGRT